jgi:hypothetical protein
MCHTFLSQPQQFVLRAEEKTNKNDVPTGTYLPFFETLWDFRV